jgi:hypothetical protein
MMRPLDRRSPFLHCTALALHDAQRHLSPLARNSANQFSTQGRAKLESTVRESYESLQVHPAAAAIRICALFLVLARCPGDAFKGTSAAEW